MILLDIEKACDTVWINGFLYKLMLMRLPPYLLFFLKSYLEGHTFTVHLNDATSTPKLTPSGLPQGAVLATTLFALYLSDMPHPPHTCLASYADDTALLSHSWHPDTISRRLSQAVATLLKYFTKGKLCLNAHKTETILFSKHRPQLPEPIQIDNASVPWASSVKYLGLLLDTKLLSTKHLRTVTNKATGTLCNIFPLLTWDSILSQTLKLTLYILLIWSLLTYAALIWNTKCDSNYKSLWVISDYPKGTPSSHLHDILNIEPIRDFVHQLMVKCFAKCPFHPNPPVQQIGNYTLADLNSIQNLQT
jgi:hypothetical protein